MTEGQNSGAESIRVRIDRPQDGQQMENSHFVIELTITVPSQLQEMLRLSTAEVCVAYAELSASLDVKVAHAPTCHNFQDLIASNKSFEMGDLECQSYVMTVWLQGHANHHLTWSSHKAASTFKVAHCQQYFDIPPETMMLHLDNLPCTRHVQSILEIGKKQG
jgi:hypothetical protein